jgi:uncharacterized protein/peptidoglycan hydrolase-like protein with peptidoglycan-binding domain
MRFVALILALALGSALGNGTAKAFDCTGVSLPSSIVICSDPELMRRADERQEAIYEARERIGEDAWPALWDDQKAWVRSYALACGIPQDRPPPIPVPASVRACFKRAAEARIAFIQGYGLAAPATITPRVGPGFDCTTAMRPLALMICADTDLSRVDLRFNQAYWALLQQLDPAARQGLRKEDAAFIDSVQDQCGLPRSGGLTAQVWQARDCVKGAYEGQRNRWLSRLSGPAYEEAARSSERLLPLQRSLESLGFLPVTLRVPGVYGSEERSAIIAWQIQRGRAPSGLLGEADARALELEARGSEPATTPLPKYSGPRDEIPLQPEGKLFVVSVRINDAITLPFILDSGASDVQIPIEVAMTLARAGTISDSDFRGTYTCKLADGSKVRCDELMLRELGLGNHIVRNVIASIGEPNSELLLGQSFLSRFGTWAIDNARDVLILGNPYGDQQNLVGAQRSGG